MAKKSVVQAGKRPRKYRKDFLDQVVARIDFAEPLGLGSKGPSADVIASLKKQFPVPELQTKHLKQVMLKLKGETEKTTHEIREWHYLSKSRHKKVVVSDACMLIEYSKYNTYDTLQKDFIGISDALFDTYEDLQVKRLGLRYIDKIELDESQPTAWQDYLQGDLLSIFDLLDNRQKLTRAFQVLEVLHDDESRIRVQYGMPNPDFPARVKRKQFTLDWDAYCTLLLEKNDVGRFLDIFHVRARDGFESVITDKLRDLMEAVYD